MNRRLYITITLLFFIACGNVNAQRKPYNFDNVFQYNQPVDMPWEDSIANIYKIPVDSVESIVYRQNPITPVTPWMQHPLFSIRYDKADSVIHTDKFSGGYYVIARVVQGNAAFTIRRKENFYANIIYLRGIMLLEVQDLNKIPTDKAIATLNGKPLSYDHKLKGYVINFKNKDRLQVNQGDDIVFFNCTKKRIKRERNDYNNYNDYYQNNQVAYKGYLVTNQPLYLPGDTVKYKAYLLNAKDNSPIEEPLNVSLQNTYPEVNLGIITPQAPGVYYSEFVLGDSVKPDRVYTLNLRGENSDASFSQQFKVEDYLLDETYLRVTGENFRYYQPGDSINLYAYGYNSNGLPVLDGTLKITVMPAGYTMKKNVRQVFIPDTIYNATLPVNPDGDTYLGFPTQDFPDLQSLNLQCYISLTNSNFEKKDTSFTLSYNADIAYIKFAESHDTLRASLIKNKRSIAGKGFYYNRKGEKINIRYPFETTMDELDRSFNFYQTDDTGGVINSNSFQVTQDSLNVWTDYRKDTAYFAVSNPKKIWFRYTLFKGNKYVGNGVCEGDSLIKIYDKRGATYTLMMDYTWTGEKKSKTAVAYRIGTKMIIDVKKKDIVFPGQTDTIGINLNNVDGKGIRNTNVTVLAFNARFKEDYTPQLEAAGLIKPGLQEERFERLAQPLGFNGNSNIVLTREWLKLLGADTAFFYKNIYFNPSHIATYSFRLKDSLQSQLAIYLREGNTYTKPSLLYMDNGKPLFVSMASVTTNPDAMFVPDGIRTFLLRTKDSLYVISSLNIQKGYKTNLFINADELDTTNQKIIAPYIYAQHKADSLNPDELNLVAKSMMMYRVENSEPYIFTQGYNCFHSYNGNNPVPYYSRNEYTDGYDYYDERRNTNNYNILSFAPFDINDSIGFFQFNNTKLRFWPELHFIYTFRPAMMRMERMSVYDLLKGKLSYRTTIPQPNLIADPAPNIDTLNVIPLAKSIVKNPKQYLFQENENSNSNADNARLTILFDAKKTAQTFAFQSLNDSAQPIVKNNFTANNVTYNLSAGNYKIWIRWADTTFSSVENVLVKSGGTTVYALPYDSIRYNQDAPPQWLDSFAYIQYDGRISIANIHIASDSGMLSGRLVDSVGNTISGALLELMGQDVDTTLKMVSDGEGYFSFPRMQNGNYELYVTDKGYKDFSVKNIVIKDSTNIVMNIIMELRSNKLQELLTAGYFDGDGMNPVEIYGQIIDKRTRTGSVTTVTADEIEKSPMRSMEKSLEAAPSLQVGTNNELQSVEVRGTSSFSTNEDNTSAASENNSSGRILKSDKTQQFISSFLNDMQQASGLRKDFRDWAIWQPNLWTDKNGQTSFSVKYPDNENSWKTYVLAMNPKGFAGTAFRLTRAFKPLSAELSLPRFLHYGDSVEAIGKLMNYSGKPFVLSTTFTKDGLKKTTDNITLQNGKTELLQIAAPVTNSTDTAQLTASYYLTTENNYTDGEEKTIPVLPVGAVENKGLFVTMMRDTAFSSKPDDVGNYFTGKTRITIDGSLLDVMLDEVENLKVYPYGCTEQLTSKLLAIYYEEVIKKMMGNDTLKNEKAKKQIVDKLVQAQANSGSFGWFAGNSADYRITNYVTTTLSKVNNNGWLDYILSRALTYLNNSLDNMNDDDRLTSLATLSDAGYASNYKAYLQHFDTLRNNAYNDFVITKIKKQQGLPYRHPLDSLMKTVRKTVNGIYWGSNSYDWYRNDLATTLIAYQLVNDDSIYENMKDDIIKYLLFRRNKGYYTNTAESGLVLTTLLPEIIKENTAGLKAKHKTEVYISGALNDTVKTFPATFSLNNKAAEFNFRKEGFAPAYVSVVYEYFNIHPQPKENDFKVKTFFISSGDTVTSLKQGEKVTLRVEVECLKDAEYVMIDAPVPAGCIQVNKSTNYYRTENYRENYKDRTVIFNSNLPKGKYYYDIELQSRYKGVFNVNPASARMMYYPDEYGNNEVKKIPVK